MSIYDKAGAVTSHKQFVEFADELVQDFATNRAEWENPDLGRFLESLAAWATSMDAVYRNAGEALEKQSPWQLMTDLLLAGRGYE